MQNDEISAASKAATLMAQMRSQGGALHLSPEMRRFLECFLETFIFNGHVDPKLRERAILRLMWRTNQPYEWARHYPRAIEVGLSDSDILSVRELRPGDDLDGEVAVVLRAVDDVIDLGQLTPETYAACGLVFSDPVVLHEFLYVVAGYRMIATVLASMGRSLEGTDLPVWPPDGIGPDQQALGGEV
jgi:4-carboxymuconolactone decarboxylase